MSKRRRWKKRWSLGGDTFVSGCLSDFKSCCCCLGGWNSDLRGGFVLECSKNGFLKRDSFMASFALVLALEQEVGGTEFDEVVDSVSSEEALEQETQGEEAIIANIKSESVDKCNAKIDVRVLALSLQSAKTADDVEAVLKDLGELPLPVFSSMIRGFGIDKRLDPAFALLEWLKMKKENNESVGPNLYIYNSLLGALKQSAKFEEVDNVMRDMEEQGVVPNIVTYNALMSIYLEQGRPNEALSVLDDIEKKGLSPSPVTYSTTLLVYRKMEDANGALKFYTKAREKYRTGEVVKDLYEDWEKEFVKLENFTIRVCYQVMRNWLVKGENMAKNVLNLLGDMDQAELRPDRAVYERLVWACTKENHYTVAKDLYRRIRETEKEISLSVCNHVIWLMGKAKKWWAALEIYEELLDKGPKPNNLSYELIVSHFNVLLTAARRRGIWRWGVRLLNKMEDKGLKPGTREWNAVLVACSKASETSAAVEIFRRMVEQGEKPTILSYGALLSALEKGKMYDEAHRVWEHMLKVGVKPNAYAYTIMASIYIGQGQLDKVDSVIDEMILSDIKPSVITYNAIISGCARKGMGSAALKWFHRMKVRNVRPNEITYEMLIEGLILGSKVKLAYDMYVRACNEGMQLSSRAYDAVVQSSKNSGTNIVLSALGPRPPEKRKIIQTRKIYSDFCDIADLPRRSKPFSDEELHSTQNHGKQ
ncbi:Pentatricopeptide repeat-containing protein [Acorus calamus]|uniref:Pentatricopeptide repeat-containing protein n=1 Tax=Acorus calamus TaxID=4465 RepID=A0AAV9EZ54_ACOCL|nr:Pentatricopeptide repeat-containing protein [Acorus calamus]